MKTITCISVFLVAFTCFNGAIASPYGSDIPVGFYRVANQEGVPVKLLWSIALNESKVLTNLGRVIAWKYTLNHKGKGYYFSDKLELKSKIESLLREGETLFDVGIAQVNYHWHKEGFSSLEEMINPYNNLTYAAQYLKSHYNRSGDWWNAVGKYHAPSNKKHAKAYRKKVRAIWESL